jgi:CO/xanthine dehydrogenase Mo-binding subunit
MRAPGEVQAVFAVESHIDMIARAMGRDPYELRLQNVVQEGDTSLVGDGYAEVRGEETLRAAAEEGSWGKPLSGTKAVGRGFSFAERRSGPGETTATLTLDASGRVTLHTPVWDTGTGAQTVLQQIISEELTVAVEDVQLDILNTDQLDFDTGVGGTRTTNTSGGATYRAAQALRAKLIEMASGMRQWPADQVVLRDGMLSRQGNSEGALSLQELGAHALAETGEPLTGEVHHRAAESDVTSFCAQVAEVEVDTETGEIEVTRFVTAHDVGTVLNPLAHQGQIDGAFMQGFGQALIEEMQTQDGRVSTLSLGDYKLPTENDLPDLVTIHVSPGPSGPIPYQGKGIGEAPIGGVAPAIANAVEDAVGVRITDLPITAEKVLRAMREKGR